MASITSGTIQTGSISLPVGSTWYICSAQPTTMISYVTTYSNVSVTPTPGFGNVALFSKTSPTISATSVGLLSAAMTQTDLNKYLRNDANLYFPTYSCFVDRVQVCAKGSNLGPLPISAIYCVLVINPNSVISFANVIVSFDNQPSTPPPIANSTSAAAQPTPPTPTTTTSTSTSGTPTPTNAITTVVTVNGGMKVKWDFMSIFIFGLSSIIWYLGGLF
ncbi:6909_t:CDS:2 [Paraglomus brasilianum]|uniref:6909_t:CDS:1 n=1 Tax=Paraglomus brasilianum TaxID=144538 RepID=A0A9N9DKK7_9GLOM|nr:6909_t:CDS:2 [Paraglomus brasilianum]